MNEKSNQPEINNIEKRYELRFRSEEEERLFFEMFTALLESRVTPLVRRRPVRDRRSSNLRHYRKAPIQNRSSKRTPNEFDIHICLAALCMVNWPGKSLRYREEVDKMKKLYYSSPVARDYIKNSLKNGTSSKFRFIKSIRTPFFETLDDLFR